MNDTAFLAMYAFLAARYERMPSDELGALLGELSLLPDGSPADPAVTNDWHQAMQAALNGKVEATLKFEGLSRE